MNIYDFDGTIYDGDSSIDFFKYAISRNKRCILVFPKFLISVMLYLLKIKDKEFMKSKFFSFIKYFDDIDKEVQNFWQLNDKKIKCFYLKQRKSSDIIISASPEFLLKPVAMKYHFKLIGTKIDIKNGQIMGNNCHGEEKVKRLKEQEIYECENFYSDSLSDLPLAKIAKQSYIVRKNEIISWNEYRESVIKKIKKTFFSPDFITFAFLGVINAFNGIWIAYVYSLLIKSAILAYILGFCTSLCISYVLNSLLNFKKKLRFLDFLKYVVSNIPNFITQVLSVVLFLNLLEFPKIIAYAISSIIAVPITFVLVKIFVYKK